MLSEVPGWLSDWGIGAGYISAIVIVLVVGWKYAGRPLRWGWRTMIGDPITNAVTRYLLSVIGHVVDPLRQEIHDQRLRDARALALRRIEDNDKSDAVVHRLERLERLVMAILNDRGQEDPDDCKESPDD